MYINNNILFSFVTGRVQLGHGRSYLNCNDFVHISSEWGIMNPGT
jgi:hypothetical protein